jgi:hypothetical protein
MKIDVSDEYNIAKNAFGEHILDFSTVAKTNCNIS